MAAKAKHERGGGTGANQLHIDHGAWDSPTSSENRSEERKIKRGDDVDKMHENADMGEKIHDKGELEDRK